MKKPPITAAFSLFFVFFFFENLDTVGSAYEYSFLAEWYKCSVYSKQNCDLKAWVY